MKWLSCIFSRRPRLSADEVVDFYRDLGFFEDHPDNGELLALFGRDHGEAFNPRHEWDDVYLLDYDERRVHQSDPECDVGLGNEVYVEELLEWAKISRGAFEPTEISEEWQSESGPIIVSFRVCDELHVLQPDYLNDYLDLSILTEINRIISPSRLQFACASDVNYSVVFVIDAEGRQKMSEVRGFPFLSDVS